MRRLIVRPGAAEGDRIYITDREDISYLSVVLRMKKGDPLLVSDGSGRVWETYIDVVSRDRIELGIAAERPVAGEDKTRVTLYQGLPKGSKMEDVVRKATELGAFRIVPFGAARAIPGPKDISAAKLERWRRVAKEASKQSRRILTPEVSGVLGFEEAAASLAGAGFDLALALYELEEGRTLKQALKELKARAPDGGGNPLNIAVFIGPEGGFETAEIERLACEGAAPVTIGDTILRTETAGPAAVAMILYELDM